MQPEAREQLRAALEEVLATVRARPRRHAHEPPVELTRAYPQILIAMALGRLEERHRARELFEQARAAILDDPRRTSDVVHTFLVTTFGLRLDEVLAGNASDSFLCARTRELINELPRIARYKIDSFREQLPTLDAPARSAVTGAYASRAPVEAPPAEAVAHVASATLGEAAIARALAEPVAQRLATLRAIARGYARAPIADAVHGMRLLAGLVDETTDYLGSSSHVQLSLVNLVASIGLITEPAAHRAR